MNIKKRAGSVILASLAVLAAGTANSEWLAADPGTPISLQINMNGSLVIRPIGGAWAHPFCPNVTAAELRYFSDNDRRRPRPAHLELAREMLVAAAANGSLVNLFTETDECNEHGQPIVRNVRIQGP